MSAQDILKMIEEVDPSDTAKLDEIDARVSHYLCTLKGICNFPYDERWLKARQRNDDLKPYTRSRDALKSIRPEGWIYDCEWYSKNRFTARFYKLDSDEIQEESPVLPTEELAELHSIIQAIDFERTK